MSFILELLGGFLPHIVGGVVLIAGFFLNNKHQRNKGKKQERQKAKEADHANAKAIRDRVGDNLADKLRDFDDAGFRD